MGDKNRRLRPGEALRRAPILFVFMFVGLAGLALVLEGSVDWMRCLESAALYSIAMTVAFMTLKLVPKYP